MAQHFITKRSGDVLMFMHQCEDTVLIDAFEKIKKRTPNGNAWVAELDQKLYKHGYGLFRDDIERINVHLKRIGEPILEFPATVPSDYNRMRSSEKGDHRLRLKDEIEANPRMVESALMQCQMLQPGEVIDLVLGPDDVLELPYPVGLALGRVVDRFQRPGQRRRAPELLREVVGEGLAVALVDQEGVRREPEGLAPVRRADQGPEGLGVSRLSELCHAQGWRCFYCHGRMVDGQEADSRATPDHMVPVSRGGSSDDTNVVASCWACNSAKGCLTALEFEAVMHDPAALESAKTDVEERINPAHPRFDRSLRPPGWNPPLPLDGRPPANGAARRWEF